MRKYFYDTAALQHRYCESRYSKGVRRIVTDDRHRKYICEMTIAEIASAIAKRCRNQNWSVREFDQLERAFWLDVASGRLISRAATRRTVLRARHLIRYAGVIKTRNIGSADAVIASVCLELALELKERVIFYTSDWSLYTILREIDAFRSALLLRFLGTPKGGIPARTG